VIDGQASKGATFTVLAPPDEAVRAGSPYPEGRNRVSEEDWIRFHILRGVAKLQSLDGKRLNTMLMGRFVNVNIDGKWDRKQQVRICIDCHEARVPL